MSVPLVYRLWTTSPVAIASLSAGGFVDEVLATQESWPRYCTMAYHDSGQPDSAR